MKLALSKDSITRLFLHICAVFLLSLHDTVRLYLLHLHHFSSHPLSFFPSLVTFVHHSPLVDFVRYNTMAYGGERNPFTGRLRRSPKSNLTRKRRSSHGLDVKTRDFLRGTVHPNIIHWMGQASLQGNMVSVYMYGPTSARHHDTTLLTWSGFDQYLQNVQQGQPRQYLFYGDSAFRGHWNCVRTRHEPTVNAPALTQQQHNENTAMRRAREGIEWSFCLLTNLWKLASIQDRFKLETNEATVMAQIRVMHLLTNCYTCIHGNNISSDHSFACKPPELEAYLTL
jgi:hypothetical protein